jgi:hypothetical protein
MENGAASAQSVSSRVSVDTGVLAMQQQDGQHKPLLAARRHEHLPGTIQQPHVAADNRHPIYTAMRGPLCRPRRQRRHRVARSHAATEELRIWRNYHASSGVTS